MNTTDANRISPDRELNARLPRFCLPPAQLDAEQKLAWVNSVCILFLSVGILGSKRGAISVQPLPPVEEVSAAIVEPLPPPAQATQEEPDPEQTDQDRPDAPQIVVVTLDSPAINFAVPTIGNLAVPNTVAQAPPISPLKAPAPLRSQPAVIQSTGSGGERPQPPYPSIALEQGQQGSVTLQMTVDDAGLIAAIEVKESSGFPVLDRSALEFVKRRWIVPPGTGTRTYQATINYKLQVN
jgi:TonB family protein